MEFFKQKILNTPKKEACPSPQTLRRALRYNILLGITTDSMRNLASYNFV